jgi:hypothetical protein
MIESTEMIATIKRRKTILAFSNIMNKHASCSHLSWRDGDGNIIPNISYQRRLDH